MRLICLPQDWLSIVFRCKIHLFREEGLSRRLYLVWWIQSFQLLFLSEKFSQADSNFSTPLWKETFHILVFKGSSMLNSTDQFCYWHLMNSTRSRLISRKWVTFYYFVKHNAKYIEIDVLLILFMFCIPKFDIASLIFLKIGIWMAWNLYWIRVPQYLHRT